MSEHLSLEQLERLGTCRLKGETLLEALKHIEECGECRSKIEPPNKAEIIEQIFCDESKVEMPDNKIELESLKDSHKSLMI